MLRHRPGLRIAIAIIVVLTVGIAAPIHAAHHHGDPGSLHSECTLCQLHSPACQPLLVPGPGISLEPVLMPVACAIPLPRSAPATVAATRAPPSPLA